MVRDQETLNILLSSISRFVRERLVPFEFQVAETDEIPADLVEEMKELGLFGLSIPEEYGGLGLTMEEEVLVDVRARPHLAGLPLAVRHERRHRRAGHRHRRHRASRSSTTCRGSRPARSIASFALTEPDAGSDAASLRTTAITRRRPLRPQRHQALHHQRPEAGLFTVMARTEPDKPGADGISAFIVERGTPGLSARQARQEDGPAGRPHLRRDLRQLPRPGGKPDRRRARASASRPR